MFARSKSSTRKDSPARETQQTVKAHLHLWKWHTEICLFTQRGRHVKVCVCHLSYSNISVYTHTHISPVWYVWWEFFQTAELSCQRRASHGTHACSLSMPMPPPSTAVHSPSTSIHTNTVLNYTVTVQCFLNTLAGCPLLPCATKVTSSYYSCSFWSFVLPHMLSQQTLMKPTD